MQFCLFWTLLRVLSFQAKSDIVQAGMTSTCKMYSKTHWLVRGEFWDKKMRPSSFPDLNLVDFSVQAISERKVSNKNYEYVSTALCIKSIHIGSLFDWHRNRVAIRWEQNKVYFEVSLNRLSCQFADKLATKCSHFRLFCLPYSRENKFGLIQNPRGFWTRHSYFKKL